MTESVRLKPKAFWKEIDLILENVKEWVLNNCVRRDYQCCGRASDILYKLFIDWGIKKYEDEGLDPYIVMGFIRGLGHYWVEIAGFIFDPTVMQFDPEPTIEEYSKGFKVVEESYVLEWNSKRLLNTCKSIRPDIYKE